MLSFITLKHSPIIIEVPRLFYLQKDFLLKFRIEFADKYK